MDSNDFDAQFEAIVEEYIRRQVECASLETLKQEYAESIRIRLDDMPQGDIISEISIQDGELEAQLDELIAAKNHGLDALLERIVGGHRSVIECHGLLVKAAFAGDFSAFSSIAKEIEVAVGRNCIGIILSMENGNPLYQSYCQRYLSERGK